MSCLSIIKVPTYVFECQICRSYIKKGEVIKSNICYADGELGSCWQITFYPKGTKYAEKDYTSFLLKMVHGSPVKMSGTVSLVKCDAIIATDTMHERVCEKNDTYLIHDFAKESDINYPVIIRCELKLAEQENILPYMKRVLDFNQDVINEIHCLQTVGKYTDVSILSQDQQEHRAHKVVLAACSEVFAAMFESKMKESLEGRIEISDMKGSDLEEMLQYIYSGNLLKWSASLCVSLFVAGDKYKIKGLKEACSIYLQENMTTDISARILVLADMHGDERLKEMVLNFIYRNAEDVLKTHGWEVIIQEHPHLVNELILKIAKK